MLEKKFEIPRNIGESNNILVAIINSNNSGLFAKPGSNIFMSHGAIKNTIILMIIIEKKNAEKILSINFCPLSSSLLNLSMKNGSNTEAETIDATETNIKSGIRNAA